MRIELGEVGMITGAYEETRRDEHGDDSDGQESLWLIIVG
jgi:hypothetical protein